MTITTSTTELPDPAEVIDTVTESVSETVSTALAAGSQAADDASEAIARHAAAVAEAAEPIAQSTHGWVRTHPVISITLAVVAVGALGAVVFKRSRREQSSPAE